MYLEEFEDEGHVSSSWTWSDFDHYRYPNSFDCQSLWMESRKSWIGRRLFNVL